MLDVEEFYKGLSVNTSIAKMDMEQLHWFRRWCNYKLSNATSDSQANALYRKIDAIDRKIDRIIS